MVRCRDVSDMWRRSREGVAVSDKLTKEEAKVKLDIMFGAYARDGNREGFNRQMEAIIDRVRPDEQTEELKP